jgi:AraC-like DNA-binding protein
MHERRVLFRGLGVSVVDFHCRAGVEPDGPEEPNPSHSIVFVRRGLFRRGDRDDWLIADPNHVLFFNADQPYRFGHPLPGGDDCTILAVEPDRARELVTAHAPRVAETSERPFAAGHALAPAATARLHYELLALLRRGAVALRVEDALAELTDGALAAGLGEATPVPAGRAARRHREAVEAVKLELNRQVASPPSLAALAERVDCSPFHLSRIFSRLEGVSLRSYLGRLRARLAAERLARGESDLTGLALDLGYSDHSHFTNSFRGEWGMPPSRFRERVSS